MLGRPLYVRLLRPIRIRVQGSEKLHHECWVCRLCLVDAGPVDEKVDVVALLGDVVLHKGCRHRGLPLEPLHPLEEITNLAMD